MATEATADISIAAKPELAGNVAKSPVLVVPLNEAPDAVWKSYFLFSMVTSLNGDRLVVQLPDAETDVVRTLDQLEAAIQKANSARRRVADEEGAREARREQIASELDRWWGTKSA